MPKKLSQKSLKIVSHLGLKNQSHLKRALRKSKNKKVFKSKTLR